MKQRALHVLLCCLLIVAFTGCGDALNSNGEDEGQTEPIDEVFEIGPDDLVMEYSIGCWYRNIEELMEDFKLVITGTIVEELGVMNGSVVRTEYSLRIDKVLYDAYEETEAGTDIIVGITGGEYEGRRYVHPSSPPFLEGEQVIMFLEHTPSCPERFAYFAQGRFTIYDNHVYTVKLRSPRATYILPQYHGKPLEDFLAEIEAAAEVTRQREMGLLMQYDVKLDIDWEVATSLEDLLEMTDLVFLGRVGDILDVRNSAAASEKPLPVTRYQFSVDPYHDTRRLNHGPVLFNRHNREIEETIVIRNPGGEYLDKNYLNPASPPFNQNEAVLLFLQESEVEGEYIVHPQGRFSVQGWTIQLVRHLHPRTGEELPRLHPIFLPDFIDEIVEAVEVMQEKEN